MILAGIAASEEKKREAPAEEVRNEARSDAPAKEVATSSVSNSSSTAAVNASLAREEGAPKQPARRRNPRKKKKTTNQTAPALRADEVMAAGGVGEIQLRGLKIEAVDKDKGVITLSLANPAPKPPSGPKGASSLVGAPGTQIEGKVAWITRKAAFVDIGKKKPARLNLNSDMASKLRWAEKLALVVEKNDPTTLALTPAAEEELAGRAPSRKRLEEFEVGMELDGYVTGSTKTRAFIDVHGVTDVVARWSDIDDSIKLPNGKRPKPGDALRVNVTEVDVKEEERVFVAILGEASNKAVPG